MTAPRTPKLRRAAAGLFALASVAFACVSTADAGFDLWADQFDAESALQNEHAVAVRLAARHAEQDRIFQQNAILVAELAAGRVRLVDAAETLVLTNRTLPGFDLSLTESSTGPGPTARAAYNLIRRVEWKGGTADTLDRLKAEFAETFGVAFNDCVPPE